jgi:hypothetical protein
MMMPPGTVKNGRGGQGIAAAQGQDLKVSQDLALLNDSSRDTRTEGGRTSWEHGCALAIWNPGHR